MNKPLDLARTKINYVALGDSISEGYSEYLQFGDAGQLELNQVSGTSWPSFLVANLLKIKPKLVHSYYNFALSSSRPEDWNYFLGVQHPKYNYQNSAAKIAIFQTMQAHKHHPHPQRLHRYFNDFDPKSNHNFDFLIDKVKKANLITFNIGANYLLPRIPYDEFLKLMVTSEPMKIAHFRNRIDDLIGQLHEDTSAMMHRLRELNSQAIIVCVGYVLPFNPLFRALNRLFPHFRAVINQEILVYLVNRMNAELARIAALAGVIYLDVFNEAFWKQHHQHLNEVFYDIHPTAVGYKKIAQDVLLKLGLSNYFKTTHSTTQLAQIIPTFNADYIAKDLSNWTNCLDFRGLGIDDQDLINWIYGPDNVNLFTEAPTEQQVKLWYQKFNVERTIVPTNSSGLILGLKKSFFTLFAFLKLDANSKLAQEFMQIFNGDILRQFLMQTHLVSNMFWSIQRELNHLYQMNIRCSTSDFIDIVIGNIFNIDNFLHYIQLFVVCFEYSKTKAKELFQFFVRLVNLLINHPRIKNIINHVVLKIINVLGQKIHFKINKKTWATAIHHLDLKAKLNEFLTEFYEFSTANIAKIKKIRTNNELFKFYFFHDFRSISLIKTARQIFNNVSLGDEVNRIITTNFGLTKLTKSDQLIINEFVLILAKFVSSNRFVKEVLMQSVIWLFFSPGKRWSTQEAIEFIFAANRKQFVDSLNLVTSARIRQIKPQSWTTVIRAVNLIYHKSDLEGFLFSEVQKLDHSQLLVNQKTYKPNLLKLLGLLEKMVLFTKPLQLIFDQLYQKYLATKQTVGFQVDVANQYYQFMFRTTVCLLLMSYNLFQKKLNKNIFWLNPLANKISPSIVNIVLRFLVRKNDDPAKVQFFSRLFGEPNNPNLNNYVNEMSYQSHQLLWYLFSYETTPLDRHTGQTKLQIILKSLQAGYWILDETTSSFPGDLPMAGDA